MELQREIKRNSHFEETGALERKPRPARHHLDVIRQKKEAPLRICLLSYRSNPHCGGQGVYLKNLSRALRDLGHHVEVISGPPDPLLDDDIKVYKLPCLDLYNPDALFRFPTPREFADPINILECMGVWTMGFPEPLTFGLRAYRFLRDKFQDYDIIHDNQSLSYGLWLIMKHVPTIATIHHPITRDRKFAIESVRMPWSKLKWARWYSFVGMQKRASLKFSHIVTVSECSQNDISKDFQIPRSRFRVIPNGINTDLFFPVPEITREKNRIIVTNSADTPLKGLRYLLLAVKNVSKTHKIKLTVIGTPKKNGDIVRLVRDLGIRKLVHFTGRVDNDEFVRQYAKASIAIVPSLYEGFGIPAGEAMACGVPVISTTGGALPEVVGDAGILVPTADSEALAKSIKELFDQPERAKEIGDAGYKRVHELFTWKKAAEKTVDVYREAIRDYRRV
ncbi:MAG: glycosyltransferase family 4 protein [Deltaproteobacteria bacterium]|nr:glycosyltransferase family 4 protein [Deltaproteobacteria bacterium]